MRPVSKAAATLLAVLVVLALSGCGSLPVKFKDPEGWSVALDQRGFSGDLAELPVLRDHRVYQVSSHDPSGGNADDSGFVAREENAVVLADLKGPGAVLRIWSANPWGTLEVYLDGNWWPTVRCPFSTYLTGRAKELKRPLADNVGGGWYSYFPIPYRESCLIKVVGGGEKMYYQVTYAAFESAEGLETFSEVFSGDDKVYLRRLNRNVKRRGSDRIKRKETLISRKLDIWPGQGAKLADIGGAGMITKMWIKTESADQHCLDNLLLRVYWDGHEEPAISMPLSKFAPVGFTNPFFESRVLSSRETGFFFRFPMPFGDGAKIDIENTGSQIVIFSCDITHVPGRYVAIGSGRLHASLATGTTEAGTPITILDTQGRGQFIGCVVSYDNPDKFRFLEGDEEVYVDGETAPSICGTGTEDYFNGGWYFEGGPFARPYHGLTEKNEGDRYQVTAYRFHVTDYIPYQESVKITMEHGGQNDMPGTAYSAVAYTYAAPRAGIEGPSDSDVATAPEKRKVLVPRYGVPEEATGEPGAIPPEGAAGTGTAPQASQGYQGGYDISQQYRPAQQPAAP